MRPKMALARLRARCQAVVAAEHQGGQDRSRIGRRAMETAGDLRPQQKGQESGPWTGENFDRSPAARPPDVQAMPRLRCDATRPQAQPTRRQRAAAPSIMW
jgi:hypothetical protein